MPAFKGTLTPAQIDAVAKFVVLFRREVASVDVRRARARRRRAIAQVHAETWQGGVRARVRRRAAGERAVDARLGNGADPRDWPSDVSSPPRRRRAAGSSGSSRPATAVTRTRRPSSSRSTSFPGPGGAVRVRADAAGVEAMRPGSGDAVLWVLDDNPRARRFYEREGWTLDGERRKTSTSASASARGAVPDGFRSARPGRYASLDLVGEPRRRRPRSRRRRRCAARPRRRARDCPRPLRFVPARLRRDSCRASAAAVCSASARRSSTAPVSASTVDASAARPRRSRSRLASTVHGRRPGRCDDEHAVRPRWRRGVDRAARRDAPGTGSSFSHQTMPATARIAAATPSQRVEIGAPTITSAPTMTTMRKRNDSASLRSGLRIRGCRRSCRRRST